MNKPIVVYTDKFQKLSGAKTKPEPWLHFATVQDKYIIYVWDTRQIVEHGSCNSRQCMIQMNVFAKDNGKHVVGDGGDIFNDLLFVTHFKIRVETKPGRYRGDVVRSYFANDILVCITSTGGDYFCTIKEGRPSRLRDKYKKTYETKWQCKGLLELFGDTKEVNEACRLHAKDDYPDLTWGYQGHCVSKSEVEQTLTIIRTSLSVTSSKHQ